LEDSPPALPGCAPGTLLSRSFTEDKDPEISVHTAVLPRRTFKLQGADFEIQAEANTPHKIAKKPESFHPHHGGEEHILFALFQPR